MKRLKRKGGEMEESRVAGVSHSVTQPSMGKGGKVYRTKNGKSPETKCS